MKGKQRASVISQYKVLPRDTNCLTLRLAPGDVLYRLCLKDLELIETTSSQKIIHLDHSVLCLDCIRLYCSTSQILYILPSKEITKNFLIYIPVKI